MFAKITISEFDTPSRQDCLENIEVNTLVEAETRLRVWARKRFGTYRTIRHDGGRLIYAYGTDDFITLQCTDGGY